MKNKLYILPPLALCLLLGIFLIAAPEKASETVLSAMKMCAMRLIPSLFPFFVLSSLIRGANLAQTLSRLTNKPFKLFFGVSGVGALPMILGFLGGYPVGVKTVCDMVKSGEISKAEASRLLLFCGNTGPAFIIGAAGAGVFGSVRLGLILYLTHIISAVMIGIFCRVIFGKVQSTITKGAPSDLPSFSEVFTTAVSESLTACLNITAYVMLFSVLSGLLSFLGITDALCAAASHMGADPVKVCALITGFLELSSGIDAMDAFARNVSFALPACAFILGWGGVSVHCQAMSFITPAGLKSSGYILSKLTHGVLAAILTCIALSFGADVPTFAFWGHATVKDMVFDYLGLFFSAACGLGALILHILRRFKHRKS